MSTVEQVKGENESTGKLYLENLDSLRFFCFLVVFLFHSFYTEYELIKQSGVYQFVSQGLFGNGNLGVNFFFVLSGFLITLLLLKEKEVSNRINVGAFYLRRVLRIWPLFFFCVFFGFVIFPFAKAAFGETPTETANPWYYIFFLSNIDYIRNGTDASVLSVLWSIGVEEQFYLVWPLFFAFLPARFYKFVFPVVLFVSIIFRYLNPEYKMLEYHTFSCIGDMAIGGLGGYLIHNSSRFKHWIINMDRVMIVLIYLGAALIFLFRHQLLSHPVILPYERAITGIFFLGILLEQSYARKSFFKLGRLKWAGHLGRISYGLYCLHFIGILIVTTLTAQFGFNKELWQVMLLETILALIVTIIISQISYTVYEKPFLKLKNRMSVIKKSK